MVGGSPRSRKCEARIAWQELIEVIKLGGSLCAPDSIAAAIAWLERQAQSHPVVVVCGGGTYADTVRSEQRRLNFDDVVAHRQALLAMEQTAIYLQDRWKQFTGRDLPLSESAEPMSVWSPRRLLFDQSRVPATWDITSDSLAAWLAQHIGANQLSLMKSLDMGLAPGLPLSWQEKGWVDQAFCDMTQFTHYSIRLVGRQVWAG